MSVTGLLLLIWILVGVCLIVCFFDECESLSGAVVTVAIIILLIFTIGSIAREKLYSERQIVPDLIIEYTNGIPDTTYVYKWERK